MKKFLVPALFSSALLLAACSTPAQAPDDSNATDEQNTQVEEVTTDNSSTIETEKDGEASESDQEAMTEDENTTATTTDSTETDSKTTTTEKTEPATEPAIESSPAATKSFTLSGQNFKYVMNGQDNPTLTVKKGDKVTVQFTSTDGFHDWVVDEFNASTSKVETGGTTSVTFTADKTGSFEYYCNVGSHRANGMKGLLVVEE